MWRRGNREHYDLPLLPGSEHEDLQVQGRFLTLLSQTYRCLIDSDIPGIRDLIDEERNWLNDEELNSSCDEETDAVEPMVEDENNVQNTGDDETTYVKASTESDLID